MNEELGSEKDPLCYPCLPGTVIASLSLTRETVGSNKTILINLHFLCPKLLFPIQDLDTIVSSKISLEMESVKFCKESLISMEIDTFDSLRSGLNSFHGELL